jgi:hypothetical protein
MSQDTDAPPADDPEDLPPLSVLVDILTDVVGTLEEIDELLVLHRRGCGDDHHAIAQLQGASLRVGQAWAAAVAARRELRPRV